MYNIFSSSNTYNSRIALLLLHNGFTTFLICQYNMATCATSNLESVHRYSVIGKDLSWWQVDTPVTTDV